jgi:hypothetical protein
MLSWTKQGWGESRDDVPLGRAVEMNVLIVLALALVLLALIGWVLRPLWENPETSRPPSVPPSSPDGLDDPFKIQQLIDLEYDYQTGKVSYEEYVRQKREIIGT